MLRPIDVAAYLNLMTVVGRRFDTFDAAADAALQGIVEHGGFSASFWARLDHSSHEIEIVAQRSSRVGLMLTGSRIRYMPPFRVSQRLLNQEDLTEMTQTFLCAFPPMDGLIVAPIIAPRHQLFGFVGAIAREPFTDPAPPAAMLQVLAHWLAREIESIDAEAERQNSQAQRVQLQASLAAAQDKIKHLNHMRRDFITLINHECRNALTGIQGFSEIIRDEPCRIDEMKAYAADINADAYRLNRTLTKLINLEYMEVMTASVGPSMVDLNSLIDEVMEQIRPTTPHHQFQSHLHPAGHQVPGDADKFHQVITSLIEHAVTHSPQGGAIDVNSAVEGEEMHVWVATEGSDIRADELPHIFDHFAQHGALTQRYINILRLDLALVKAMIQGQGGRVWADSPSGRGSVLHFAISLVRV